MPMLKFTLLDGAPIWIAPDKVAAVQRDQFREGSGVTHTLGAARDFARASMIQLMIVFTQNLNRQRQLAIFVGPAFGHESRKMKDGTLMPLWLAGRLSYRGLICECAAASIGRA
jgi:hypothetical protein